MSTTRKPRAEYRAEGYNAVVEGLPRDAPYADKLRSELWKEGYDRACQELPEAYRKLVQVARDYGLPKHYRNDLVVHDREAFTSGRVPPTHFMWVLRTSGTHIWTLDPSMIDSSPGNSPVAVLKAVLSFGDTDIHVFTYKEGRNPALSLHSREVAERICRDALDAHHTWRREQAKR